jgi:D-alanine-D-alanine ligase
MILRQSGLPTPDFAVLETPDSPLPELAFPLIVKPKNEAVSFGLRVVHDEAELRAGAQLIFDRFHQPVLAEQYIEGREINVGLLGNNPPEALPSVELLFPADGPSIYTHEDKTKQSGRTIDHATPAPIGEELQRQAAELAVRAFNTLGCYDYARVDMRLDNDGVLYILEVNSLPSLGEHGSYLIGAAHVGLDFSAVINRLVEAASARYFGTPTPPTVSLKNSDPGELIFGYLTERRDRLEGRLKEWVRVKSRTSDPLGLREAKKTLDRSFTAMGLQAAERFTDDRVCQTWETPKGLESGTLFVGHLDVPVETTMPPLGFRRDPEWIHGEGVGSSRAPLVCLEFALRALRSQRRLRGRSGSCITPMRAGMPATART